MDDEIGNEDGALITSLLYTAAEIIGFPKSGNLRRRIFLMNRSFNEVVGNN
jgi:hypothetical protein